MTKEDIIQTAFEVWGRRLYRTTSLTDIAGELGVSKTALYRHFASKDALLDAMHTAFFDECADFIRADCERAAAAGNWRESSLIMMRAIAEYYMRRRAAFVFSVFVVYDAMSRKDLDSEFRRRGIDLWRLSRGTDDDSYPSQFQLMMATLIFSVSGFHIQGYTPGEVPGDKLIAEALDYIEGRIVNGLGLDARKIAALDYGRLEKQAAETVYGDTEDNTLLKAVAGAVAEAGPWGASMEMVARRSGLSKSGLYAHFKNRQDMLDTLFITEFSRIANFAKAQIETTRAPEEQLYLAIISVVNYLRSRPEILVSIDWIKSGHLNLGKEVSARLYRIMGEFKLDVIRKQDRHVLVMIAHWMLFLVVNIFAWRPRKENKTSAAAGPDTIKFWERNAAEISNESFRVLFRFIALGLEGLINA